MKKLLFAVMIFAGSIAGLGAAEAQNEPWKTLDGEALMERAKKDTTGQFSQDSIESKITSQRLYNEWLEALVAGEDKKALYFLTQVGTYGGRAAYSNLESAKKAIENKKIYCKQDLGAAKSELAKLEQKKLEQDNRQPEKPIQQQQSADEQQQPKLNSQPQKQVQQQNNFINKILTYKKTSASVLLTLCAGQWIILYKLYEAEETDISFADWLSDNLWTAKVITVLGLTLVEAGGLVYLSTHQAQA